MEDTRLMNETAGFIKDSLHTALLNVVKSNYSLRTSENVNYAEINNQIQQGEIIFLFSEIEQNLSYLIDKKRSEADSILHAIELQGNQIRKSAVYITLIIAVVLALFMMFYFQYTINAFTTVLNGLEGLSNGRIPATIPIKKHHAFSILFSRMNLLYDYLARLVTLSKQILEKDFSGDIKPLGDEDQLGKALVDLQSSLRQASEEEEKRKKEDLERQWVSEGIARINDILRISGDKIEDLAYQLIKEIVGYTNSSLGALFVVNNENPEEVFFEMNASYAYDRRKYIEKHIYLGEGMVGRCASEKEVLYLTDIPEDDLSIQSGLGESKPVSLLIAPLKIDNSVYGVIELASFELYEPYQISFIQTIGENIAITISKLKINLSTSILLEQTRKQTRELSAQEEEMRKNMEVLRASQEQSSLREENLLKEIEQLKKISKNI